MIQFSLFLVAKILFLVPYHMDNRQTHRVNQFVLSRREIDLVIATQMMRSQRILEHFSRFFIFSFVKKLMHSPVFLVSNTGEQTCLSSPLGQRPNEHHTL